MKPITEFIISEINREMAHMFMVEPKIIDVKFVPLIERKETLEGDAIHTTEKLGTCNIVTGQIQIVPTSDWGNTLIHELIHLYKPEMRHPQVKNCVRQCIQYLKLTHLKAKEGE